MLNLKQATFGAEYEYGDCYRQAILPKGLSWNTKDYSIVSESGIANDPKGELYDFGGEINTEPTVGWKGQIGLFHDLVNHPITLGLNYRTNLHIHIGIPGLSEDLPMLKQILRYIDRYQDQVYAHIEPIPKPTKEEYPSPAALKGAMKRYNRRKISHQKRLPQARVEEALGADTPSRFIEALATPKKDGGRAWAISTRAGINMMQLRETDTIEFRHFSNTVSPGLLLSCFEFVESFMDSALRNEDVANVLADFEHTDFPPFHPYNHAMEIGYEWTNFSHNSRKVVKERLRELENEFDLHVCDAADIAPFIVERSEGKLSL